MTTPVPIGRRSLMKGVAWAAPVVAVSSAAPAFAQSGGYNYGFGWSIQSEAVHGPDCKPYIRVTNLRPARVDGIPLPKGFSVYEMATNNGREMSPTTTATIKEIYAVYEIPQWMIADGMLANPFLAGSRWGAWVYRGDYDAKRSYADGTRSVRYYFRWTGRTSHYTQPLTPQGAAAWPGSGFDVYLCPSRDMHSAHVKLPDVFFGGYRIVSGVNLANGGSVSNNIRWNETARWIPFSDPL